MSDHRRYPRFMNALKTSCGLLIACTSILLVGCQNTDAEPADTGCVTWGSLKASLRAPSTALNPKMWIRCVVLDRNSIGLGEGLHDWEEVERLRDRLGDKVPVRSACVLEGLKGGAVEIGYYLTAANPDAHSKSFHGLRFEIHEVRIEGQELGFKATLSLGLHQADIATHDGRRGLQVFPVMRHIQGERSIWMRSNQVQVLDLGFGSYVALIEILDAPVPESGEVSIDKEGDRATHH